MSKKKILVTGGAGYIGSHTVLQLIKDGYEVIVLDNLERGHLKAIERVEELTGRKIDFYKVDLRHSNEIEKFMKSKGTEISGVIHFAAYKDVGEADIDPEKFYFNNVIGTYNLIRSLRISGVNKIIFSSTSAVYGNAKELPIVEKTSIDPQNAYGKSKSCIEWMLEDYFNAYGLSSVRLRYFNAAGAHDSGRIGEDPKYCGNLLPMVMQTLVGEREKFLLYGDKFDTKDGTQERDYIHVMDLATAHVASLKKLENERGSFVYNLGTGKSTSVKTIIELCEKIIGKKLNYEVVDPRPGDPLVVYCDPTKANNELNWKAKYNIEQIIKDQWKWVEHNPRGYQT